MLLLLHTGGGILLLHDLVLGVPTGILEHNGAKLNAVLNQDISCTLEADLLGLIPLPNTHKVGNCFLNLAFILAKRQISMTWKSAGGLAIAGREAAVMEWAWVEYQMLYKEEAQEYKGDRWLPYGWRCRICLTNLEDIILLYQKEQDAGVRVARLFECAWGQPGPTREYYS
ncbi:hypothetical protein NDU88_004766 [Pleurodeles waltl]|uniref:Uncharacterized protein n=1 Tax=Pleurodeles waltl TaxID=8319 RepID=A0AAV7UHC3_PLEWA|nr:hypothetical protein NDU88_004766 [Pleurodeles waltl]